MTNNQTETNSQSNYQTKQNTDKKQETNKQNDGVGTPFGGNASFQFETVQVDDSEESLRRPRSQTYLDAIHMMDMLSSTDEEIIEKLKEVADEELIEEFKDKSVEEILEEIRLSIREELESREIPEENNLEGVISKCYISGCYVHSISSDGTIINHYTRTGNDIPPMLEPGRRLYEKINGNCSCIEVYTKCCRIIATDGSVEKVNNVDI